MQRASVLRYLKEPVRTASKVRRNVLHRRLGVPWFKVRETDAIIASFPRSGNTWVGNMLLGLVFPDCEPTLDVLWDKIPETDHLEFAARLRKRDRDPLRMIKTHERGDRHFMRGRVLYLIRSPFDVYVSWYQMRCSLNQCTTSFSEFIAACLAGRVTYGDWASHVRSWLSGPVSPNLLVIRYEDMRAEPHKHVRAICSHIGLAVDDAAISAVIERSSRDRVSGQFASWASARGMSFRGGIGVTPAAARPLLSRDDISMITRDCGDLLELFGYPVPHVES